MWPNSQETGHWFQGRIEVNSFVLIYLLLEANFVSDPLSNHENDKSHFNLSRNHLENLKV